VDSLTNLLLDSAQLGFSDLKKIIFQRLKPVGNVTRYTNHKGQILFTELQSTPSSESYRNYLCK